MSQLGKQIIEALEEAKKDGLVTLQTTPNIAQLRKNQNVSNRKGEKIFDQDSFAPNDCKGE